MKDVNFDTRGMTNGCPLMRDRSFYDCTDCHHFINFNSKFIVICNFPGVRGRPRAWFYKVNQWVDEDSVTYKVLEMRLMGDTEMRDHIRIFDARYVKDAIIKAKDLARQHHCKFLDINCPKGSGGRKIIVLK